MAARKAVIQCDEGTQSAGTVINLIECGDAGLAGLRFPLGQVVWDVGQYPVIIGDRWEDGVFSRDGQPLTPVATDRQKILELEAQLGALLGLEEVDSL